MKTDRKKRLTVRLSGVLVVLSDFSDTCSFTAQVTQVVEFRTTYTTTACHFDLFDFRRVYREGTLNTYTVRDLTYCKRFGNAASATFDYYTFEDLDTLA